MFKQPTVRTKLLSGFGLLALMMLVTAAAAIVDLSAANDRFSGYIDGIDLRLRIAMRMRTAVDRRAIAARNLVLVTSAADIAAEKAEVLRAHADVQRELADLNAHIAAATDTSPPARAKVAELTRLEGLYGPVALAIVDLALKGQQAAAIAKMNTECRPLLAQLSAASDDYTSYSNERAQAAVAAAASRFATQRAWLVAVVVAALILAVAAGLLITRGLVRALGAEPVALGVAARRVAAGDLREIAGVADAPDGSVLQSLGAMQRSLATIVGQVRDASDSIATGSAEIATGNADLSRRTEQQAAALEETSATMTQLGATVRSNADNATLADRLAKAASEVAERGGAVVHEVVDTMKSINESSRRIADILGVIDGIAFQTNILALNAAVEAARAGEQGRGFAVVAGEVRSLAQRSAESAREIKTLITASVERVAAGTALVDRAGDTMTEVVTSIRRVSEIVGEISAASVEQSTGVAQVGEAVTQMDRVTQQNAALVEESAAAAESLRTQAGELVQAVAVFQLAA